MPIFGGKKEKKSKAVAAIEELLDEADAHLKSGDLDKAASEYRRAHRYLYREENIGEAPDDFSMLFTRAGHGLFETGEPDRAVECFDKATQLNPKNTDAWMSRGIVHMKNGAMLNYAVMCFDEVLKYNPDNLEALENKMEALLLSDRKDEAVEILEKMVELEPDNEAYRKKLEELAPENLDTVTAKLKKNPKDPKLWRKRAELLEAEGNIAEAIESYLRLGYLVKEPEVYERVLELNPNNMTALDKLIELRPDDVSLLSRKASSLVSEGKSDEALALYERMLELEPDNQEFKARIDELKPPEPEMVVQPEPAAEPAAPAPEAVETARPEPAVEPVSAPPAPEPEPVQQPMAGAEPVQEAVQEPTAEPEQPLGPAAQPEAMPPEQVSEPEPAVQEPAAEPEQPAEPVAAQPEAIPPEQVSEPAPAVQEAPTVPEQPSDPYQAKIAADPNNPDVYAEAGDYYFENDQLDKALECFSKAVELSPNDTVALHNKGSVLYLMERFDEAIATFDRLLSIDAEDTVAYLTKGAALYKAGRYDDAIQALNNVVKRDMNDAAAWYYKACAEARKGNLKPVVPFLKRATDLEDEFKERAKSDPAFDPVRDSPEFQAIVNG